VVLFIFKQYLAFGAGPAQVIYSHTKAMDKLKFHQVFFVSYSSFLRHFFDSDLNKPRRKPEGDMEKE